MILELEVVGRPIPQGSMSAFAVQNKATGKFRGVVTQGGSKQRRAALAEWRAAVRDSVFASLRVSTLEVAHFVEVALAVEITFRLGRPASHYGTGKNAGVLKASAPPFPIGAPDVDKLARAVLDSLKGTAFDDDSRVVDLHPRKVYAAAGESEGARIRIRPASELAPVIALVPPDPLGAMISTGRAILDDMDRRDAERAAAQLSIANMEAANAELVNRATTPAVEAVSPEEKKRRARERVQRTIAGSPIAGELKVERELRKSHALERHTPPAPMIDEDAAAALRAGDANYRVRVLGQCDGDHPMPECPSAQCWRRDPIGVAIKAGDRAELARRLLEAPAGSDEERRCIAGLSSGATSSRRTSPSDVDFGIEDFGGPDL